MSISLPAAVNLVAQVLADASQSPHGLTPAACRDAALVLDRALAAQAPTAVVVPIAAVRRAAL